MNEFSQALLAYHNGDLSADFLIQRDDGFQDRVPVSVFFDESEFSSLERKALYLCAGRVLDVGAAAGRHSLSLIRRGMNVTSLDILPEMEWILMAFSQNQFETVLMLMNGIGMVETIKDYRKFLRHADRIVTPGGQILCCVV